MRVALLSTSAARGTACAPSSSSSSVEHREWHAHEACLGTCLILAGADLPLLENNMLVVTTTYRIVFHFQTNYSSAVLISRETRDRGELPMAWPQPATNTTRPLRTLVRTSDASLIFDISNQSIFIEKDTNNKNSYNEKSRPSLHCFSGSPFHHRYDPRCRRLMLI